MIDETKSPLTISIVGPMSCFIVLIIKYETGELFNICILLRQFYARNYFNCVFSHFHQTKKRSLHLVFNLGAALQMFSKEYVLLRWYKPCNEICNVFYFTEIHKDFSEVFTTKFFTAFLDVDFYHPLVFIS